MVKLLPIINLTVLLWIWIAVIAIIKVTNIVLGFVRRKKLVALHTVLNKATGTLLFLLPFTLQRVEPTYSFAVVCIIATIAAIQESYRVNKSDWSGNLFSNYWKQIIFCYNSNSHWQHSDNKNLGSPYFTDNLNTPDNMSKNTHTKLFKSQFSGASGNNLQEKASG